MEIIKVEELTKKYKTNIAVNNVSFSVKRGELFGFLDVNGAGKSTVINILSTLLKPTKANIKIAGYELGIQNEKIRKK